MRYLIGAINPRPFIGALIGAGAAIGGALIGRQGQKDANVANAQQAEAQMRFQQEMSRTAHQREVEDLRAAGLNPILSGTGGAGASTPPGAAARIENVDENTAATAQQIALNRENLDNLKETNKQIRAETVKKVQEGYESSARTEREKQHGSLLLEQRTTEKLNQDQIQANTALATHNASIAASSAKGAHLEGEIDETKYGAVMRYINRAMRAITGGSSAIRNAK